MTSALRENLKTTVVKTKAGYLYIVPVDPCALPWPLHLRCKPQCHVFLCLPSHISKAPQTQKMCRQPWNTCVHTTCRKHISEPRLHKWQIHYLGDYGWCEGKEAQSNLLYLSYNRHTVPGARASARERKLNRGSPLTGVYKTET
jgi:hypothetical protein